MLKGVNNLDQGIHNYLVYLNKLPLKIKNFGICLFMSKFFTN